jgi:cytochrome c-type biogenesis protein CcmH
VSALVAAGAGALLLFAIAFLAAPFLRTRAAAAEERRRLNVELYRDRLAELDREAARGEIAAADHASLRAELALTLLEDTHDPDATAAKTAPRHRALLGVLVVGIVGAATTLYAMLGALDLVALDRDRAILAEAEVPEEALATWTNRLEAHVSRHPDDAKSWFLLGHARLRQDRFEGAAAAFETLTGLTGDDPVVLSSLAQARYLADDGTITDATRSIMMRVLAASPHDASVREMLALDAFRGGRFDEAVEHLEAALAGGVGGARADALRHALERALAAGGGAAARADGESAVVTAPTQPQAAQSGIRVQVSLAPGVAAAAPARVFVIAREAGGPPMPIAVRVLDPGELPTEVVLSDADAMQPGRALSAFERVDVVARLSRSGSAVQADGDVESGVVSVVRDGGRPFAERVTLAIGG